MSGIRASNGTGTSALGFSGYARPSVGDQIWLPRENATHLFSLIHGARAFNLSIDDSGEYAEELYAVPCITNKTLKFEFLGVDVDVPPANWISKENSRALQEGECLARIVPYQQMDEEPTYISLGNAFLSSVYTVFKYGDEPSVGFIPLTDAAKGVVPQMVEGSATANSTVSATIPGYSAVSAAAAGANADAGPNSAAAATGVSALAVLAAAAAYLL
jgi:hypothetical protein